MKNYISFYSFYVIEKIKEGKTVYYLDRKLHDCGTVNRITVEDLTAILKADEQEPKRFEFWYEEETEAKEIEE
jgi:hypothetical protein